MSANSPASKYVSSSVVIPSIDQESIISSQKNKQTKCSFPGKEAKQGNIYWIAQRIKEKKPEVAIGILDIWTYMK